MEQYLPYNSYTRNQKFKESYIPLGNFNLNMLDETYQKYNNNYNLRYTNNLASQKGTKVINPYLSMNNKVKKSKTNKDILKNSTFTQIQKN